MAQTRPAGVGACCAGCGTAGVVPIDDRRLPADVTRLLRLDSSQYPQAGDDHDGDPLCGACAVECGALPRHLRGAP